MDILQTAELLSYVVTIFGLPFAILVFLVQERKERENEEEDIYERIVDSYTDFLTLTISNPDLKLRSTGPTPNLDAEQEDRIYAMFEILMSIFERAYLLTYEEKMSGKKLRRWMSWENFVREWCQRDDFRSRLPQLLAGEDPDFAAYIRHLAAQPHPGPTETPVTT